MAAGVASNPRALARLGRWLRSDMPRGRWVFLIIHLALLIITALALDYESPKLLIILIASLLVSIGWYYLGFGLLRPASRISRARLFVPASINALFLTVLAAGTYYSLGEATESKVFGLLPDLANQWVLLYGCWLYGDLSIIRDGPRGTLSNVLIGVAEVVLLVFIVSWLLIALTARRSGSRFDLAMRFSLRTLLASLLALAIILPSHIVVSHRGGFFSGVVTNPSLRGASLSLLFSLGTILMLIFLRPFHRRQAGAQSPWCRHCGYDLRASPDRCPECGEPVVFADSAAAKPAG